MIEEKNPKTVKRILFLVPNNVAGGAERVLVSLANELSKKYIETYFMTFDAHSDFYPIYEGVNLVRLNAGTEGMSKMEKFLKLPVIEIRRWRRMRKNMKGIKPDIVISFMFMTNIIGWLCCKELNIPIVLSERNDPLKYGNVKRWVMNFIYPKVDGFVCQSDIVKLHSENNYGLNNIVVIPNPLGENQVAPPSKEKKKHIISVGRLIPQKNHTLLIKAFANIASDFKDYQLYIYGDGPLRQDLFQLVETLNLTNRVFLPGIEKDAIMNNNDATLFVMSSDFEGYPNSLVEAMANGIASICSDFDSGSARNIIQHGENGYLFPVGNIEELENRMRLALNDTEKLKLIAKKGEKIYYETNLQKVADLWLGYFNEVYLMKREK